MRSITGRMLPMLVWSGAIVWSAGLACGQAAEPAKADAPRAPATRPSTRPAVSLHREMEAMGRSFKALGKQISDPAQNASSLALLADLQQHTVLAKNVAPPKLPTVTDADRPKHNTDYRGMMITVLRLELELEEQLLEGKNVQATKTLESMHEMEEQGHKEYQLPPKKR